MARKSTRTLRKMAPLARELAKIGNELQSINTRLMNLTEKVAEKEGMANALGAFMVSTEDAKEPKDGG